MCKMLFPFQWLDPTFLYNAIDIMAHIPYIFSSSPFNSEYVLYSTMLIGGIIPHCVQTKGLVRD